MRSVLNMYVYVVLYFSPSLLKLFLLPVYAVSIRKTQKQHVHLVWPFPQLFCQENPIEKNCDSAEYEHTKYEMNSLPIIAF
jgi:hypothetical protein